MNDNESGNDTTKPVFKMPRSVGGHRVNDLYNRFRQIMIEFSGLSLTDLAGKNKNKALEEEILEDFMQLKSKYDIRQDGPNDSDNVSDMCANSGSMAKTNNE